MDTHTYQSHDSDTRRHCRLAIAGQASTDIDPAGSVRSDRNPSLATLAVLGVVVIFMVAPAVIASISIFDRALLGPVRELRWIGILTTSLEILPLASTVALTRHVAGAREEV
jgi:hypothetical protein